MNLRAIKAKFPEYASMSEAAFFNLMHREYYSDMSRAEMYRAMLKLTEVIGNEEVAGAIETIKETTAIGINNKDKGALIKLGHTLQDISKMPHEKAMEVIEKKIEKPQEEIKAERQAKALDDMKAMVVKTLEEVKALGYRKSQNEPMKPDTAMHGKMDILIKEIATPKPKEVWEFEIIRDERGNMDKIIAKQV